MCGLVRRQERNIDTHIHTHPHAQALTLIEAQLKCLVSRDANAVNGIPACVRMWMRHMRAFERTVMGECGQIDVVSIIHIVWLTVLHMVEP